MMALNRVRTFFKLRTCGEFLRVYNITAANLVNRLQNTAAVSEVRTTDDDIKSPIKPFSEIPGPKGAPLVGTLFDHLKQPLKNHERLSSYFQNYGLIMKEKIGVQELVWLADVDGIEQLLRQDGKYPVRIVLECWRKWRDSHGHARGVLTEDGPNWKRMRTSLDKQMMRPKNVANFADRFNEVVTDFVARLRMLQESAGAGKHVPNLDTELFHWSLETIGTVLYETRLGGLSEDRTDEIAEFIHAVHLVFRTTERMTQLPPALHSLLVPGSVKKHDWAWTTIMKTGQKLIDGKLKEIERKLEKGEDATGFLSNIIASSTLSMPEVYANISELMLGAVDTFEKNIYKGKAAALVRFYKHKLESLRFEYRSRHSNVLQSHMNNETSNTMQWMLYELSRDAEAQAKLHTEITSITPRGTNPNLHDLEKMKYLRSVIKETLRLYPLALIARVIQEDMELLGYHIPAGKVVLTFPYFVGRRADIFPEPDKFQPERWLRDSDDHKTPNPFAWVPFGFGTRMCVGRRVADLEMRLLLARLIQNFELRSTSSKPILTVSKGLMIPDRPVEVEFVERP